MDTMDTDSGSGLKCIYVASFHERAAQMIQEKIPDVKVVSYIVSKQNLHIADFKDDKLASKVEILFGYSGVFGKYRHRLTNLKWFHTGSNGVDPITKSMTEKELQSEQPYVVSRNPGYLNAPYATEYIIGHILARERFLFEAKESQFRKEWIPVIMYVLYTDGDAYVLYIRVKGRSDFNSHRDVSGLTIGILGVGEIGQHLANVCKTFGMTVWGMKRYPRKQDEGCPYVDVYRTQEGLMDILENCDYIVNALPSTTKTRHMLSGDILRHCEKKKAVFINVARGDIIDEDSLVKALRNGWLGGAILDVVENEPLSPSSPLWEIPGVTITPHVSAYNMDIHGKYLERVVDVFVANYHRYIRGESIPNQVDLKKEY